jgi:hypothetical protein
LLKKLKTYERNMEELTNSIKRQKNWESLVLKKKRCKQKEFIIYSTK